MLPRKRIAIKEETQHEILISVAYIDTNKKGLRQPTLWKRAKSNLKFFVNSHSYKVFNFFKNFSRMEDTSP